MVDAMPVDRSVKEATGWSRYLTVGTGVAAALLL
jgi:hypothetical protein